jgi:hypothetical protein
MNHSQTGQFQRVLVTPCSPAEIFLCKLPSFFNSG